MFTCCFVLGFTWTAVSCIWLPLFVLLSLCSSHKENRYDAEVESSVYLDILRAGQALQNISASFSLTSLGWTGENPCGPPVWNGVTCSLDGLHVIGL